MTRLTGQEEPLALVDLGGGQAQVDLTLGAGDVVLFKYPTARPFPKGP